MRSSGNDWLDQQLKGFLTRKLLFARRRRRECTIRIQQLEGQIVLAEKERDRQRDPIKAYFDDQHARRVSR